MSDPDHHDPVVALLMKGDLSDSATVRAMRKAATDPTLWSFVNPTTREALFIPTVRLKILGGTLDDLLEDLETFSLLAINQRLDEIFRERKRTFFYGCLAHAKRGETVCDNALVLPIERVDRAVQAELATNVLRPAVVRALINAVFKELQPKTVTANVGALQTELRTLDKKIANLTDAIENGAAVAPLVAKLQARQTERDELFAAIGAAEAVRQITVDRPTVERRVLEQVTKWQALLSANVADSRQALREVLDGPIRFEPSGKQYRFSGRDLTRKLSREWSV